MTIKASARGSVTRSIKRSFHSGFPFRGCAQWHDVTRLLRRRVLLALRGFVPTIITVLRTCMFLQPPHPCTTNQWSNLRTPVPYFILCVVFTCCSLIRSETMKAISPRWRKWTIHDVGTFTSRRALSLRRDAPRGGIRRRRKGRGETVSVWLSHEPESRPRFETNNCL